MIDNPIRTLKQDIDEYLQWMISNGYSFSTCGNYQYELNSFLLFITRKQIYGKDVFTEVKGLSGGERIRLKLAMLLYQNINMLILDEPTNHLDIETIETLEKALETFDGTLLFVSHDRYFINRLAKQCLALKDGKLIPYENYQSYRQSITVVKDKRKTEIKKAPLNQKLSKPVDYEKELILLEKAYTDIEEQMVNNADYQHLMKLEEDKNLLSKKIETLYEQWG